MCTMSMVGDHYREHFEQPRYYYWPFNSQNGAQIVTHPTQEEFDALKREVEDMKKLLLRAKEYDERNGEPHCEMDEKVALLKQVAKLVGVDLDEVFGTKD